MKSDVSGTSDALSGTATEKSSQHTSGGQAPLAGTRVPGIPVAARAERLSRLNRRPPVSTPSTLHAPAPHPPPPRRRARLAWLLLSLAGVVIVLLAALLAQTWQRADELQAEVAALHDSAALQSSHESQLNQVLQLQEDKLAGQETQLQSTGQDMQSVEQELQSLRDRMARLDQHNAELRDALGLTDDGDTTAPVTATVTLTPGPNGFAPGGEGGETAMLYALTVGAPQPAADLAALSPADQLAALRAQMADVGHGLDAYAQVEDDLTSYAADQVQQWAQMDEDDDTSAPPDIPGGAPTPAPAPPPKAKGAPPPVSHVPSGFPYYGPISSPFGWRISPFVKGQKGFHKGIDIVAKTGTAVRATQAGKVIIAGWSNVYGNEVMIDHGAGWQTIYGHNSRLLVKVGQQVAKGQIISYSGSTGMSTGPHIHYEIHYKGVPVDPMKYR